MLTCDQDIYSIGDAPTITATFLDLDGNLADPTTVTFAITNMATGVVVTHVSGSGEVTNPSVGVWKCALGVFTVSGRYAVKATGAGALAAVGRAEFVVRAD